MREQMETQMQGAAGTLFVLRIQACIAADTRTTLSRQIDRMVEISEGRDLQYILPVPCYDTERGRRYWTKGCTKQANGRFRSYRNCVMTMIGTLDGPLDDLWLEEGGVTSDGRVIGDTYVVDGLEKRLMSFRTLRELFPWPVSMRCGEFAPHRCVDREWDEYIGRGINRYAEKLPELLKEDILDPQLRRDFLLLVWKTDAYCHLPRTVAELLRDMGAGTAIVDMWKRKAGSWMMQNLDWEGWERACARERERMWQDIPEGQRDRVRKEDLRGPVCSAGCMKYTLQHGVKIDPKMLEKYNTILKELKEAHGREQ